MKVYFVQVGQDGYLPDSVSAYPTLREARQAAIDEKQNDLNDIDGKIRVLGNIRKHWSFEVLQDESYHHSIRIDDQNAGDIDLSGYPGEIDMFNTRKEIEFFCVWYNEHCA
jgi:hypothetical protein